jgi:hypothetical protein
MLIEQNTTSITDVELRQPIATIEKQCAENGRAGIATGHFMSWPERSEAWLPVYTSNDLDTFTHNFYLDSPAETIAQRVGTIRREAVCPR